MWVCMCMCVCVCVCVVCVCVCVCVCVHVRVGVRNNKIIYQKINNVESFVYILNVISLDTALFCVHVFYYIPCQLRHQLFC